MKLNVFPKQTSYNEFNCIREKKKIKKLNYKKG